MAEIFWGFLYVLDVCYKVAVLAIAYHMWKPALFRSSSTEVKVDSSQGDRSVSNGNPPAGGFNELFQDMLKQAAPMLQQVMKPPTGHKKTMVFEDDGEVAVVQNSAEPPVENTAPQEEAK